MTTLREAAQQFVADYENGDLGDLKHYARALRAALAQEDDPHPPSRHCMCEACKPAFEPTPGPEQEPVAWSPLLTYPNYEKERVWLNGKPRQEDVEYWSKNGNGITYVYTHPPRREWQGLTTQEAMALTDTAPKGVFYGCDAGTGLSIWIAAVAAAERALKEKNNG